MNKNRLKKVRFAPSLSGGLHLGSASIALANFDYSKYNFYLRIDDTNDNHKYDPYKIIKDLNWLGIYPKKIYKSSNLSKDWAINYLINNKLAYYLDDGAIAFNSPTNKKIWWRDIYCGIKKFNTSDVFSKPLILCRKDGTPTYNFASVIDDINLGITHVIRGNDHVANTPKQIAIFNALGYKTPHFGHLGLILNPYMGGKLSKSYDLLTDDYKTFSIHSMKNKGYIADSIKKYLRYVRSSNNLYADWGLIKDFNRNLLKSLPPKVIAGYLGMTNNPLAIAWASTLRMDTLNDLTSYISKVKNHKINFYDLNHSSIKRRRIALTGLTYGPDYRLLYDNYRINKILC